MQTLEAVDTAEQIQLADMYEVILYNDDVNLVEHVVNSLVKVFGHTEHLAVKITLEAHERGNAIAAVEEQELAQLHKDQLQTFGLTASIHKV